MMDWHKDINIGCFTPKLVLLTYAENPNNTIHCEDPTPKVEHSPSECLCEPGSVAALTKCVQATAHLVL
jgi:hypothetical protein